MSKTPQQPASRLPLFMSLLIAKTMHAVRSSNCLCSLAVGAIGNCFHAATAAAVACARLLNSMTTCYVALQQQLLTVNY